MQKQLCALMIGAHPDDCEGRTGGFAIKFSKLGHVVKFVSATNGNAGHYRLSGDILSERRLKETRKVGEKFNIETRILDINDGKITADIKIREEIITIIRKFKPDLIFTHRTNDYHPDHRTVGILVQDASFLIRVPNICPAVPALNYTPVIMYMPDNFEKPAKFEPDILVDISDVFDKKVEMMDCHESQVYEWLPWLDGDLESVPGAKRDRIKWLSQTSLLKRSEDIAQRYRDKLIEKYGKKNGMEILHAEAFEISEYGAQITEEQTKNFFPF